MARTYKGISFTLLLVYRQFIKNHCSLETVGRDLFDFEALLLCVMWGWVKMKINYVKLSRNVCHISQKVVIEEFIDRKPNGNIYFNTEMNLLLMNHFHSIQLKNGRVRRSLSPLFSRNVSTLHLMGFNFNDSNSSVHRLAAWTPDRWFDGSWIIKMYNKEIQIFMLDFFSSISSSLLLFFRHRHPNRELHITVARL